VFKIAPNEIVDVGGAIAGGKKEKKRKEDKGRGKWGEAKV